MWGMKANQIVYRRYKEKKNCMHDKKHFFYKFSLVVLHHGRLSYHSCVLKERTVM